MRIRPATWLAAFLLLAIALPTGVHAEDPPKNDPPKKADGKGAPPNAGPNRAGPNKAGPNNRGPNKNGPPNPKAAPKPPETVGLAKLREQLDALRARVDRLSEEAGKEPEERLIAEYARYGVDDFKQKKRVKAKDLLEWVFDAEKSFETVRHAAVKALAKVRRSFLDPDLSSSKKGSRASPRAALSIKVISQLKNKDDKYARILADILLKEWWGATTYASIGAYKASAKHKGTWGDAAKDWGKYLRKR